MVPGEMRKVVPEMVEKDFQIYDLVPQNIGSKILPFLLNYRIAEQQCIETR